MCIEMVLNGYGFGPTERNQDQHGRAVVHVHGRVDARRGRVFRHGGAVRFAGGRTVLDLKPGQERQHEELPGYHPAALGRAERLRTAGRLVPPSKRQVYARQSGTTTGMVPRLQTIFSKIRANQC